MAARSFWENFGPTTQVQWSSCWRMIWGLRRSAAACKVLGSGPEEGVVVFAKGDTGAFQFALEEGGSQFHAHEDEVNAELIPALPSSPVRTDMVFLADSFFGPLHGNLTFPGEGLHPVMVMVGSLPQDFLADGLHLVDIAVEVDDVLRAREQGQMTEDDDAIETVVYQGQQAAKQLCKGLHRFLPVTLASRTRSSDKEPMEIKISNIFG